MQTPSSEQFKYFGIHEGEEFSLAEHEPEQQLISIVQEKLHGEFENAAPYEALLTDENGDALANYAFARAKTAEEFANLLEYARSTYPKLYVSRWSHAVGQLSAGLIEKFPEMFPA